MQTLISAKLKPRATADWCHFFLKGGQDSTLVLGLLVKVWSSRALVLERFAGLGLCRADLDKNSHVCHLYFVLIYLTI